jgi:hypothetical protein
MFVRRAQGQRRGETPCQGRCQRATTGGARWRQSSRRVGVQEVSSAPLPALAPPEHALVHLPARRREAGEFGLPLGISGLGP